MTEVKDVMTDLKFSGILKVNLCVCVCVCRRFQVDYYFEKPSHFNYHLPCFSEGIGL